MSQNSSNLTMRSHTVSELPVSLISVSTSRITLHAAISAWT
jgi:hypothetical protein